MKLGNTSNMIPYDDVFVLFVNIYGGHTWEFLAMNVSYVNV
jgi:hypothetical protein